MRNTLAAFVIILGFTRFASGSAELPALNEALNSWATRNGVGLSSAVRSDILEHAQRAIQQVHNNRPEVPVTRLEELVTTAVISYLDSTQNTGRSLTISDLLENLVAPSPVEENSAFGPITIYPILVINIIPADPPDFVISIDNEVFRAEYHSFRVSPGDRNVSVTRTGKAPCNKTITVTAAGPNRIECSM